MAIPLIISIVVAVIGFVLIIIGLIDPINDGVAGLGLAILVLDGFFGFLLMCGCISVRDESVILPPDEIARSQYTLFVKCNGNQLNSTEAKFVMASNDVIRVKKTIGYNSYGGTCGTSYELFLQEGIK
jgi:hypothetical protein